MRTWFNEDGKPRIRKSFCVYMDVLGFSEMTRKASENEIAALALLDAFFSVHKKQIQEMRSAGFDKLPGDSWWGVNVFTDNIVLGFPIREDGESEFGFVIDFALRYQYEMALAGFFVRGGMSIGQLFMDEAMVFGEALLEAHELEQVKARDPRIIISGGVKACIAKHLEYYADPYDSPQNREVLQDPDGEIFLNYLICADLEENGLNWDGLIKHKEHIENNLKAFQENPRIWAKYLWLSNYHDWFVNFYKKAPGYSKDICIDSKLIRTSPQLLIPRKT